MNLVHFYSFKNCSILHRRVSEMNITSIFVSTETNSVEILQKSDFIQGCAFNYDTGHFLYFFHLYYIIKAAAIETLM